MTRVILILSILSLNVLYGQQSEEILSGDKSKSVVSGFYNRINTGILGGSDVSLSFQIINGYKFNENWNVGLGLGTENFFGNGYIPLFLESDYAILKQSTTPFLSVMTGYELPIQSFGQLKGGITFGGKIGFDYFVREHVGISTSIGYRYGRLVERSNFWDDFKTISIVNRYEFRIGVVFK